MLSPTPIRPLIARWRDWLPLAILLVALSSLFALGGDRGWFYRSSGGGSGMGGALSHETLAIAENLSPEHRFLMTLGVWEREDGSFRHDPYNRFPVGVFALVRLAIAPFGSDLAAKLMAGRALALLMFCGAAVFAYLAIARIAESRWIALAAVLLAFSGIYAVYHADFVFNETMDLFGVMLVFHGMVLFVQEGRFRQLLIKVCAALLLGWHVYALIMPFALLGFGGEALALVRSALASGGGARAALSALPALARSRFAALAAGSILFGSALLALNFANEYASYGGRRSLPDLPSVRSMTARLGAADVRNGMPGSAWGDFSMRQLHRAGASSAPYAVAGLAGREFSSIEPVSPSFAWAAWGVAAALASLAGLALVPRRFRVLMASVALTGFCWAVALRYNTYLTFHSYEGLHYVGLPLALWSVALIGARRLLGGRLGGSAAIAAAALAAPLFALSVAYAAQLDRDDSRAERDKAELAEFGAIMEMARGSAVVIASPSPEWGFYDSHAQYSLGHYLAGSYTLRRDNCESLPPDKMDFVLSAHRDESLGLLTPDNRFAFLYAPTDPLELCRSERRRLESSEPLARAEFDVYFQTDPPALHYLKPDCAPEDGDAPFFVYAYSENPSGASGEWESWRVSPARFKRRAEFDGACLMTFYHGDLGNPMFHFQTGQYISGGGRLWEVVISPPPSADELAAYESEYQEIASREPAAQSGFDLYLDADGDTLAYLKRPCSQDDVRGRFFLSVHPSDDADLPAERRALGHDSRNFAFEPPHAAVFNGKCMATIQLPDYEIAKLETGQDAPGGRLWETAIVPPSAYERVYQAIASGEPAAQSGFDLYLDADGGAISYLKQPCSQDDIRGRFFLSVHPADAGDLPEERRELGHESLNFNFKPPHGVVFNGKCMATIQLPDYEIAKLETGQDAPGGGRLWAAAVAVGE